MHLEIDAKLSSTYLDQLLEIDRQAFGIENPDPVSLSWAEKRPELYTVLRQGEEVRGYGLTLPLRKAMHEALKQGQAWEEDLALSALATGKPAGHYLAAIAAVPNATERERALLVGATIGPLLRAPEEIIAIPVSQAGDRICSMIHMNPRWSSITRKGLNGFKPMLYTKEPWRIYGN